MEQKQQQSIKQVTSSYSKQHNLPKLLGTLLEVIVGKNVFAMSLMCLYSSKCRMSLLLTVWLLLYIEFQELVVHRPDDPVSFLIDYLESADKRRCEKTLPDL